MLLDVNMPGMNGFEVCTRLKTDEALKDIPVLFISAMTDTSDKVKAFKSGGVDYITKPFQIEEVKARVETHLELRRRRLELQQANQKLKELEELRGSLVHMIVHDMRTPLTVITSCLYLIDQSELPDSARSDISEIINASKRLMDMVSSLLDVSKMEADQMSLQLSDVKMNSLIEKAVIEMKYLKGSRSVWIELPRKAGVFIAN